MIWMLLETVIKTPKLRASSHPSSVIYYSDSPLNVDNSFNKSVQVNYARQTI